MYYPRFASFLIAFLLPMQMAMALPAELEGKLSSLTFPPLLLMQAWLLTGHCAETRDTPAQVVPEKPMASGVHEAVFF